MDSSESESPMTNKLLPAVAAAVVISAFVAGGGMYAYQKGQADNTQKNLQAQIDSLQSQMRESKMATATSSPTPMALTTPVPSMSPSATSTSTPITYLTGPQLLNFTYKNQSGQDVILKDGSGTFAITGGPGELTIVQNGPVSIQTGDLDGDGSPDSVVYLVENDGGTGSFPLIAAVLNKNGQPVLAGVHTILEDRATVDSISVNSGIITVKGKVRSSGQSLSSEGSQSKTEMYKLSSGKLVSVQ